MAEAVVSLGSAGEPGIFTAAGGVRIAYRIWRRPEPGPPRGVLIVSHGHGEHGGCYAELADRLVDRVGVAVVAFDRRGHGLSDGKRGTIARYADLGADLAGVSRWVAATFPPGVPIGWLGHSHGALIALRAAEVDRELVEGLPLAGLILSNPPIRLSARVPLWKRAAGQLIRRVAPRVTLDTGIDLDHLTTDPDHRADILCDGLRHTRIDANLYYGMTSEGPKGLEQAGRIDVPTLLILGGADPIADPSAGRAFFEAIGTADKELADFAAMKHEPLREAGRAEVFGRIEGWLARHLPARP